jgi:hypothetical protein
MENSYLKNALNVTSQVPNICAKNGSALNLRNGYMLPEYNENHKYINSAVVIHLIEVPCNLFETDCTDVDFWRAALFIRDE